ncbi:calcium/sodium antiporter [Sporosarcina sp. Marseille-Q4063]|uniref:calcium/sodium antiporter n=1 Tax=Sporosarcina sp. Marseille-Q4063 TaxID=2810514 RepID=UPI001BAF54C4|nr:calcium/sodium antiporter [Sporosarcina sp. Marseille-Q4063]QUW20495.1 calcium/sodium antiporter [Sporosarcina sp. Marseille-Q4063]
MTYLLLLVGFALLIIGADYFVKGASAISALLRVPPILVGLTIVSFGTSSPEATVSIIAALNGNDDVSLGNVVGSNLFNTLFVLGVTAFIAPLIVKSQTIRKEIPFSFLASITLLVLMADIFLQDFSDNMLTRSDGIILLLIFAVFLYYIFELARKSRNDFGEQPSKIEEKDKNRVKNGAFTLGGLAAIVFGGDLVVKNSTEIALSLGMSEALVGLTIVAVGTSLPELVTSAVAAWKKESEIALGNIIGSNIFNILFVLGASATISPIRVNSSLFTDITILIVYTIVVLIFALTRLTIGRREGIFLAISYIVYMVYIILRN